MKRHAGLLRPAVMVAVAVGVFAFGNARAWAQGATAAPFNKVTVSDDVAKRTLMKAVTHVSHRARGSSTPVSSGKRRSPET